MEGIGLKILLFLLTTSSAVCSVDYDAVLSIVVVELVFAFSIGLICILFSLNLYKALLRNEKGIFDENDQQDSSHSTGALASLQSSYTPPSLSSIEGDDMSDDYELEFETSTATPPSPKNQGKVAATLSTFSTYLRLW